MRNVLLLKNSPWLLWVGMLLLVMLLVQPGRAIAGIEFLSISETAVIMYESPSLSANKLYVASRYLPVEAVVDVEGWVKVRDSSGSLTWVEKKALSSKRYVIVTIQQAKVYQAADTSASLIFQVKKDVVLEWLDATEVGWVKVRHHDGETGYIRVNQVWGI